LRTNRKRSPDPDSAPDSGPERERAFSRRTAVLRGGSSAEALVVKAMDENARASTRARWTLVLAGLLTVSFLLLQRSVLAAGESNTSGNTEHSSGSVLMDAIVVCILVLITGVFVLCETALLTVRRTRIEQLVEANNKAAKHVAELLSEPTRMLATLQVGLTMVQLFSAGEAANRFVEPFRRVLVRIPEEWFFGLGRFIVRNASSVSFVTIIFTVGLLTLVIGEITPKSIAIRYAERISLVAVWPTRWLQILLRPLVSLVTLLSNLLVLPFGGTATFHTGALSEEELKIMVEQSEEHGVIETEEKEMIHKVFEFADTVARKVMTPRLDITAIEADVGIEQLIRTVTDSGHSRLPVYDDDLDNIIGIVHVKDVLKGISGETLPKSIRELMRAPYFIPESKRVDDLLGEFRRNKMQMAIVRDEDYGTVTGLVTIEDLLEEIVGDIQDEYDIEEEPMIRQIDDETCIVEGKISLEEFNDRMGIALPMEETDTLGGFVFGLLGHQPDRGEWAVFDGLEFGVEETDGRRIQKVRVCRRPGGANGSAGSNGTDAPVGPVPGEAAAEPSEAGRGEGPGI
jgi:putative hemolysin